MDSILNKNVKAVHKLNGRAKAGGIKNLYLQIEIGHLCLEGYTYWKANKKALKMSRDELLEKYNYGRTYFGDLRKVALVSIEDVERYIESRTKPKYTIDGLLKFLKPEPEDKPKNWYTFSVSKEIGGGGARFDEKLDVTVSGNKDEVIEHLETMLNELKSRKPATIELLEVIEA